MDMDLDLEAPALQNTLCDYQKWTNMMFKKLGWVLLAKHDNHNYIAPSYLEGLNTLVRDLKDRVEFTQEQDRKLDLMILHRKAVFLCDVAHKALKGNLVEKSIKHSKSRRSTRSTRSTRSSTHHSAKKTGTHHSKRTKSKSVKKTGTRHSAKKTGTRHSKRTKSKSVKKTVKKTEKGFLSGLL